MTDTVRAYVAVSGGVIAILIALASSLSIGPGPIFTFDKVVVGALLVGGLGALQVSVNIGNSPEARAERMARARAMTAPMTPVPQYSDLDRILERVKRIEAETNAKSADLPKKVEGRAEPPPVRTTPPTVSETQTPPQTGAPTRPVAAGGPDF